MGKKKDKKGKKGKDKGKAKAAASAATAKKTAASSGMSTKEQQILPAKFAKMFDGLTYAHQRKQYKRALKSADAILEKYPENGETLAIKGLILMDMSKSRSFAAKGKKAVSSEDPEALVKKGLSKNFKSSVCWHVCGLMNRVRKHHNWFICRFCR